MQTKEDVKRYEVEGIYVQTRSTKIHVGELDPKVIINMRTTLVEASDYDALQSLNADLVEALEKIKTLTNGRDTIFHIAQQAIARARDKKEAK